uniref:uncharacterized protein LOC122598324 n=1 Tax=Erigeron canadensis TaxID=72917 RepID=UPI001CB8B1FE|nr:uncharacterized protein LOC122598324 [Erigeron canadensis]
MLPPKKNPFENSYSKASKMSAHQPIEIQAQIMKRLPVRILIQLKMVSKAWKALIESSEFMADYNISQTGPNHLFIRYGEPRVVGSSQGLFCLHGYSGVGSLLLCLNSIKRPRPRSKFVLYG